MRYRSAYAGRLILPGDVDLALGDHGEADPDNAGVAEFVALGWLVPDPEPSKPKGK